MRQTAPAPPTPPSRRAPRAALAALAAVCGLALAAAPAAAQAPGVDLKLMPKIGAFAPLSELQEVTTADGEVTRSLESSLALGLAVEVGLPVLPTFRVNLDYATSTRLDAEEGFAPENADADVRVIALVADVVMRRGGIGPLSPYLLVGGGLKWYDFPDVFDLRGGSDLTGHIGVGLELDLEFVGLAVEVSDYISRYQAGPDADSELQNDIFAMVGFRVGLL